MRSSLDTRAFSPRPLINGSAAFPTDNQLQRCLTLPTMPQQQTHQSADAAAADVPPASMQYCIHCPTACLPAPSREATGVGDKCAKCTAAMQQTAAASLNWTSTSMRKLQLLLTVAAG
jgi:bacterioferritin-associated ferredoxin